MNSITSGAAVEGCAWGELVVRGGQWAGLRLGGWVLGSPAFVSCYSHGPWVRKRSICAAVLGVPRGHAASEQQCA